MRILIVEDEPSIAIGLEDDLALEGYEVELARDGNAGAKLALEGNFDLILLDVMMPGRNGFDVCRELRHKGLTIPIILLTAKSQEAEKVMGLELGADDYVTKPFSPAELRARIKALLRRAGPDDLQLFRFGDFEADFARFELRRGGKAVHVTPLELKLLSAFVRNKGKALKRAEIKDDVWGKDVFMTDRVIDTHIVNLRKKIGAKHIASVRGIGYRFEG